MTAPAISPFTFLTWKEDEHAVVASTSDSSLGYIQILTIDGIDIDDIVAHAKDVKGETALMDGLATNFPNYVAAVAAKKTIPCFVTSGKAEVEYADLNTGEVSDSVFSATESNYKESVRVEEARAEYTTTAAKTTTKTKKTATTKNNKKKSALNDSDDDYEDFDDNDADAGDDDDEEEEEDDEEGEAAHHKKGEKKRKNRHPSHRVKTKQQQNHDEEDDDEDYEDVEEDEEDYDEANAYQNKRRLLDMVSTQLQTAMSIAFDVGLSVEETSAAYETAAIAFQKQQQQEKQEKQEKEGKQQETQQEKQQQFSPIPRTAAECLLYAKENPALEAFLSHLTESNTNTNTKMGEEENHAAAAAAAQGANCPQQ